MTFTSMFRVAARWLVVGAMLASFGFAVAQAEPTLSQVYATAQAGKIDQAQVMVQQVLVAHPKSGKAHFVRAELYARQGDLPKARESLAAAEQYSPGLAFAKPDAVQALRAQLAAKVSVQSSQAPMVSYAAPVAAAPVSSNWVMPLLLAGGAIVAGYFVFRRRTPQVVVPQQAAYPGMQGGLGGPQTFGMGGGAGGMQPTYPQPAGYPQQGGYPQAAGSGMGGRIMGGVATGLAVGAGVMAAEAIGRNLMGNHNPQSGQSLDNAGNHDFQPINSNPDMGGANFGVNDTSSWDDAGSGDVGGGGDWDN